MIEEFRMPKSSQTVETCILTGWYKNIGDQIAVGDILFAYETDKAAFEEEATIEGILLEKAYEEGDEIPVLSVVGYIGTEDETVEDLVDVKSNIKATKQTTEAVELASDDNSDLKEKLLDLQKFQLKIENKEVPVSSEDSTELRVSPRAKNLAKKKRICYDNVLGSGPAGRIIEKDIINEIEKGKRLTPLAMKKVELDHLVLPETGKSPFGKITSKDLVEANLNFRSDASENYSEIELSNVRKIIAGAMIRSLQNSAQLTHHLSACALNMLKLRKEVKSKLQNGYSHNITVNDMVCYAVVRTLKKFPEINSHLLGDKLRIFNKVNLGIAVDTERGLLVPTLIDADDFSLTGLSARLKELTDKSKNGKISPDLLHPASASFTVSNLGNYGVEMFTPIINLPQVAILGVNTIVKRPAELEDGTLAFLPFIGLSLTYDHRAIDGGPATLFLREVKTEIEKLSLGLL